MNGNSECGATIVEAGLVLPVFFLLLLAILEFGLVYSTYQTMLGAVREGARYAVAPDGSDPALGLPAAAQVAAVVCAKLQAGIFGAGNVSACGSGGSPTTLSTGPCPTSSSPPSGLTADNVYLGQCTVPVSLPFTCKTASATCGTEVYQEIAVHRTVQVMWGWRIPLTAFAIMRSEAN